MTGIRRFRIDEIQTPAAVAQSAQRRPVQQVRGNFQGIRQARVAAECDLEPVNRWTARIRGQVRRQRIAPDEAHLCRRQLLELIPA